MAMILNPATMLPLFIFLFLLSHFTFSFSKPLQYQTLITRSLLLPQPHTWDDDVTINQAEDMENMTITLQLYHIDSLFAGHANFTAEELFRNRLQRDANRMEALSAIAALKKNCTRNHRRPATRLRSPTMPGQGNAFGLYYTRIGIGTPSRHSYLALDTGSDLIWIQCKPCTKCFQQPNPIFDPKQSSTFGGVACNSTLCQSFGTDHSCNDHKCMYQYAYGDGNSSIVGALSTETLTFGRNRVKNIAFGCVNSFKGMFAGDGILGLGGGRLSFPTQAGRHFGHNFSYCLVDLMASSKPSSIIFGSSAVSPNTIFIPIITNPVYPEMNTYYYVGLTGISIGGHPVHGITASLFEFDSQGSGGVIIDSGTTLTYLPQPAYEAVRKAFRTATRHLKSAGGLTELDTCYDLSGVSQVTVPTMSFHFKGATIELSPSNILIQIGHNGTYCFAFAQSLPGFQFSIIGNIQQQGFQVMFDLSKSRVGFSKGCSAS